ncbi:hypothetical protein [Streptomyces sp. TRM49041]|nr:hypothetical protein [Streptomyces sp. TRM49041]
MSAVIYPQMAASVPGAGKRAAEIFGEAAKFGCPGDRGDYAASAGVTG